MFKKKKDDDEWFIGGDDFYDTPEPEPQKSVKSKTPRKPRPEKTRVKQSKRQAEEDFYENNYSQGEYDFDNYSYDVHNRKPNSLRKREGDRYEYDSFDDYVVEMDEPRRTPKWIIIVPLVIVSIITIGVVGYFNTDFDNNGNPYVVSLELHYERKYVKEADELLNMILDINKTIDADTAALPNNYVSTSSKLGEEMAQLKAKTTEFSKYVGVPKKFESYHGQLISFSLSTQNFINKLITNYNDPDFESFRESGISDYYNSLEKVKQARTDIDNIIFRNMEVDSDEPYYQ